jgi:HSP20 family protein
MCRFDSARMAGFQQRGYGYAHPRFGHFAKHFAEGRAGFSNTPVNVRERRDWYEIFIYAPGLNKDAFQVSVSADVLSVRFTPAETFEQDTWLHQEYQRTSFERHFALHGKVDTDSITARYTDGVLELTLPKLPGTEGQSIAVA